jgi:hypothetical protein
MVEAVSAPLRAPLVALRAQARIRVPRWEERLALVRRGVEVSDAELRASSEAIALERYGAQDAHLYAPEPPVVTELARLSTRSPSEVRFAARVDALVSTMMAAKPAFFARLSSAKGANDLATVRAVGAGMNALVATANEARDLDVAVRTRLSLAASRIDAYRTTVALRPLAPSEASRLLRHVPPSRAGYEQVLDFYRQTDAAMYNFGRQLSGAQHFNDIRRNVAILHADGCPTEPPTEPPTDAADAQTAAATSAVAGVDAESEEGARARDGVFSAYAVSGARAPGLNLRAKAAAPFAAIACADGLGGIYMRDHDAEYKLVTALCTRALGVCARAPAAAALAPPACRNEAYRGTVTLWSKKPLCQSCQFVVRTQLVAALPNGTLRVLVDDENGGNESPSEDEADAAAETPGSAAPADDLAEVAATAGHAAKRPRCSC